jgi:Plastocyanin
MNKKLVGSVIAIVAVIALVTVFIVTRPDDSETPTSTANSSDSSTDATSNDNSPRNNDVPATETNTVDIEDFAFAPVSIKVKKGETVTWTNKDSSPHTVTGTDGAKMDSGTLDQGKTYSFTFDEAGTFTYKCDFHPSMTGTVVVE